MASSYIQFMCYILNKKYKNHFTILELWIISDDFQYSLFDTTTVLTLLNIILTEHQCDELSGNRRINVNFNYNKSEQY